jgi:hypothetical protein
MAILAAGEVEIIVNSILMKLDRRLDEQPNNTKLVKVKEVMIQAKAWAKVDKKIGPLQLKTLSDAGDTIRENFREDTGLSDQLFDLLDFFEYHLG